MQLDNRTSHFLPRILAEFDMLPILPTNISATFDTGRAMLAQTVSGIRTLEIDVVPAMGLWRFSMFAEVWLFQPKCNGSLR